MAAGTQAQPALLYSRRARGVWSVIALSTLLFCVICAASGFGLYGYVSSITRAEGGTLELITGRGAQLEVTRRGLSTSEAVRDSTAVGEHDVIKTGRETEANVGLFDGTQVHLYFSTTLMLSELRTGRFVGNQKLIRLAVAPNEAVGTPAQASISTADLGNYTSARYIVTTPHAEVEIAPEASVRVQIDAGPTGDQTRVVVTVGSATVVANGERTELGPGLMAVVPRDGVPSEAQPPEQDLVRNGDFTEPPTSGVETIDGGGLDTAAWLPVRETLGEEVTDVGGVSIRAEEVGGQVLTAAVIDKQKEPGSERYVKVGVRQDINAPTSFLQYIELRVTVKVVLQTEPVGGPQGDVYPLTARVLYTDSRGQQKEWRHSFFICPGQDCEVRGASPVPLASWSTPEERQERLGEEKYSEVILKQLAGDSPRGQDIDVINAVELYGIGNSYQSWVTDVSLIAR